ncbi:hypothetical protein NEOLEDRAFT_1244162, partial [Neolentinus lepideus HHB14362 ss-1]
MSVASDFVEIKRKRKRPGAPVDPCLGFYSNRLRTTMTQAGGSALNVCVPTPVAPVSSVYSPPLATAETSSSICKIRMNSEMLYLSHEISGNDLGSPRYCTSSAMQDTPIVHQDPPTLASYIHSQESSQTADAPAFGTAPLLNKQSADAVDIVSEDQLFQHVQRDKDTQEDEHISAYTSSRSRRYHARYRRRIMESQSSSTEGSFSSLVSDVDSSSQSNTRCTKRRRHSKNRDSKTLRRRTSVKNRKRDAHCRRRGKSLAEKMFTAAVLSHVELLADAVGLNQQRRPLQFTTDPDSSVLSPDGDDGTQRKRSTATWRRSVMLPSSEFSSKRQFLNSYGKPMSYWSVQQNLGDSEEFSGRSASVHRVARTSTNGVLSRIPLQFVPIDEGFVDVDTSR